jgi:formylglycine-generating enzyme required for sulfatase activity
MIALIAMIAFSGCAEKPDEKVVEDFVRQNYEKRLLESFVQYRFAQYTDSREKDWVEAIMAVFEIKAQITDRLKQQDGTFLVYFNYTVTGKKDVTVEVDSSSAHVFHIVAGVLQSYDLLYPFPYAESLPANNYLYGAKKSELEALFGEKQLVVGGVAFHCEKGKISLMKTEKDWASNGMESARCALSPEAKAEAERKLAEVKRKEAEAKAEAERKLAEELKKPLVEVQNLPTFKNSIGMEFVLIPPGSFQMGCTDPYDDPANARAVALGQMKRQCNENEIPQHKVTLTKPFYIAKDLKITGGMWYDVTGEAYGRGIGENEEVDSFWFETAQKFIAALNKKENTTKYRLPTEAELDYAMRAGTTTKFFWGDNYKAGEEKYKRGDTNQYGLSFVYEKQLAGDCYGAYSAKDQVDPANQPKKGYCGYFVGRGKNATWREEGDYGDRRLRIVKDQ